MKKLIAIYRTVFLLPSEAFICVQASSYSQYNVVVWCREIIKNTKAVSSLEIIPLVPIKKKLDKLLFTLFGLTCVKNHFNLPDIIHAHFGPDAAIILPFAQRNQIPLIVTFHGFDAQQSRWFLFKSCRLSNWLFLLREKKLYKYAKKIIVVSDYLNNILVLRGCPVEKIIIRYIGIDTKFFTPSVVPKKFYRLINISRHVTWKGIDTIIKALPLLTIKYPDLYLVQIGAGPETAELKTLAEKLGVANHIEWLGALSHDKVYSELKKSCIYIQASHYDKAGQTEAFGISLLEAQACGLPVIATRTGGIPEAMSENNTGLLFEEHDYKALADNIDALLSNPKRVSQMEKNARLFVVENFNINDCTAKLETIYDEVLTNEGIL